MIVTTLAKIIWAALQLVVACYVVLPFLLLLLYILLRAFNIKTPFEKKPFLTDKNFDFAFIVTAHQEAQFILPIVDSILKQTYPHFTVYVVADDCDISGMHFKDGRVQLLKPEPALHAKIKSIQFAVANFSRAHDALIILDSDNLLHPHFLHVMNAHFQKGYRVVQCDFKPKNEDTRFARMDAIGDLYNFFLDREMRMRLGLSASIWGSGVAIDTDLYKSVKYEHGLGGFDKRLQAHLMQSTPRIAFAPDAVLYDEKIDSGASLETQRTRWIFAHFRHASDNWKLFVNGLKRLDFNLIYNGFVSLRPPLFITLGAAFLIFIINLFINPMLALVWAVILFSFVLSFVGIVAIKSKNPAYLRTLFSMPLFVLRQVAALFKIKKANRSFLKTKHTAVVYIDDVLKENR